MSKINKILVVVFAALIVAVVILIIYIHGSDSSEVNTDSVPSIGNISAEGAIPDDIAESDKIIENAFYEKKSDISVEGQGTIVKLLADDTKGNEHQKFIVELASGHSLLFAHNISISKKINDLEEGDTIKFAGEYVWNEEGGLVHWTHHDPSKKHADGWLEHNGKTYN